jgi:phosphomannomutase
MTKKNAEPVFHENGMEAIKEFVMSGKVIKRQRGKLTHKNINSDFYEYVLGWIEPKKIKPQRIVVNANFGLQGNILDEVIKMGGLPLEVAGLNYEPDGNFPKGKPNPYLPENRPEFVDLVKKEKPDLGVAFDADGDRIFFATGEGIFLEPYYTNTILIRKMLQKFPGSKIIYDPRNVWALTDEIIKDGGKPVISHVGHSYIKAKMREEDAVFCGESSGHTYYKDFWYADSGIIPLLQMLEILSEENKSLGELVSTVLDNYFISGEFNFTTSRAKEIMELCKKTFSDAKIDEFEGITVEYVDWRFNLRNSNTEPLLRINVEAKNKETLKRKFEEVTNLIKSNL